MASAQQHPVRGFVRDQKDDSLLAIKEWLIRNPRSASPELYSDPLHPVGSEQPTTQEGRQAARQAEIDDAPSIAAASQSPVDLIVAEYTNHTATQYLNNHPVVQGDDVREGGLGVRTPSLRALACAVLLFAVAAVAYTIFLSGKQKELFDTWSRLKDWSSYELHTIFPEKGAAATSERSDVNIQGSTPSTIRSGAQSSTATAGSSEVQHQFDAMSEDSGLLQRTMRDGWNRSKEWFAYASHAIFSNKSAAPVSERSEVAAQSVIPPSLSAGAESASASAKPSELQHQPVTKWEEFGPVWRPARNSWNRLKEWLAYASSTISSKENAGTVSERSEAVPVVTPSVTSSNVETPTAAPLVPATVTSASSELQHQLDTISTDLDSLQRIVADLTIRQEQIVKDIAALQSAQQSVSLRLSALPRSLIAGTSHKNVRRRLY